MKKINIIKKNIKMKWHTKLLFAVLFCILLITIAALVRFYYKVNNQNNEAYLDQNIIADFDSNKSNYKIYKNDNGLLGVMNKDDRTVIEPQWNNIYFLNSNRFVVQKKIDGNSQMGIIDIDENFIVPFIFKEFAAVGKDYLIGYFDDEDGFSVFDTSGNLLTDKKWLDYSYDENSKILTLTNKLGNFNYIFDDDKLICTDIKMTYEIKSSSPVIIKMDIHDENVINEINSERLKDIFDISCVYFESLIYDDMKRIKDITNSQFYQPLSSNDYFKDCKVKSISDVTLKTSDTDDESYELCTEITYDYIGKHKTIDNLKSAISLSIIEDSNGSMILKSITKEEL
ncbi:hypothetical protein [Porcipelethomonas sp.]|uniref:hypothetical protein n=1 Tax=Porcipelethomonas sp. TaxID=2981675 RepID=UPI003EFAD688